MEAAHLEKFSEALSTREGLRDLGNMVLSSGRMRDAMPSVVGTKGDRVPIWGLCRTHRQPFLEASHRLNHINYFNNS